MDNRKDDAYYIHKIKKDLAFMAMHMEKTSMEELETNEILLDSMLFRMIQVSENAKKLSDTYKDRHSGIPWGALSGMRNRIVHDYGNVELGIVYETLKNDIPELLRRMM